MERNHRHMFLDNLLYCSEEKCWEEEDEEVSMNYFIDCSNPPFLELVEQDLFWEEDELTGLFFKEQKDSNFFMNVDEKSSFFVEARQEAVEWMLKVHAHYGFSALTAVLATSYLDRFFMSCKVQKENPWMVQLTAVACLTLAAKVEETQVPLLLDFQVEETKYVFEAKTIQKMEILVLSSLQWKMNPVTPLSFIDHITRRLGLNNLPCKEFLRRCDIVLLSLLTDFRYISYLPSVMAAATMLHVIDSFQLCISSECQNEILGILKIDQEDVDQCCKLIQDNGNNSCKRKFIQCPGSPRGIMDASFCYDSSIDSWEIVRSVSSSPEPLSKRVKAEDNQQHHRPSCVGDNILL